MPAQRLIIVAASISAPGQMGGNTKIAIEMARNLPALGWTVEVVVPSQKLATFANAIGTPAGLRYHPIKGLSGEFRHFFSSIRLYTREFARAFARLNVSARDIVYATCNFHFEIVPLVFLKRRFNYIYLPSHYLFSPFIIENLVRGYRFPAIKWLVVWIYERLFFCLARTVADGFVITNDSDRRYFGKSWSASLFPVYGGVNVEQIPGGSCEKTRDAVFCSRLHPQKGVESLLEIWSNVITIVPSARLSLVGNGASSYEKFLRKRAAELGVASNIEWLGYVNNEAKYRIYKSATVFVHSTIYDNNGMVAAEALCSGLPVVMYDLPALRTVYTDGCAKVPFGDSRAFAETIARLLTDADYRSTVAPSEETVARLKDRWNWPNRMVRLSDFLKGLHG